MERNSGGEEERNGRKDEQRKGVDRAPFFLSFFLPFFHIIIPRLLIHHPNLPVFRQTNVLSLSRVVCMRIRTLEPPSNLAARHSKKPIAIATAITTTINHSPQQPTKSSAAAMLYPSSYLLKSNASHNASHRRECLKTSPTAMIAIIGESFLDLSYPLKL